MKAVRRFIGKHWKQLLFSVVGSALAGVVAQRARNRLRAFEPEVDTGPIVQEPTLGQRLGRLIGKRKRARKGNSGGGGVTNNVPTVDRVRSHNTVDEPTKRTPIPQRPKSKDISEEAQRARDNTKETAKRIGYDGPDFGITRRHK
jgi:hypothetical protein